MNGDEKSWKAIRMAMREAVRGWINDPNVTLIDYGWRERGGVLRKDEPAIRVHVATKISSGLALETATRQGYTRGQIPDEIGGFPVDVLQGSFRLQQVRWFEPWRMSALPRARRVDPMLGGISIANARLDGYGTLGGAVVDRDTGAKMILSNWHVLAGVWHARPGWPILQPGSGDGGRLSDTAARLSRHAMESNLDAAVAELTGERNLINSQFDLQPVRGMAWALPGMEVIKSGRKSGVTRGVVSGVEGTTILSYSGVRRQIRNVITIEPREPGAEVSAGGDSGSFWLDEATVEVVGLHFAGGNRPERALAIDIQPILNVLNVDLLFES